MIASVVYRVEKELGGGVFMTLHHRLIDESMAVSYCPVGRVLVSLCHGDIKSTKKS